MTKWAMLLPILAAAALPTLAQDVGGKDEVALREVHAGIVDAYNHQDIDRLTEYLHPEVAYLIPSRPAVEGKDAVRAMYEGVFDRFRQQGRCLYLQARTTEVVVVANWAWTRGETAVAFAPCGKPPTILLETPAGSKFVGIYKKENGRWLRYRQMRNGNSPDMNI
jgi:ketosteroid isomerase-like protein